MITTPVKLWRRQKGVSDRIGREGKILNWTIIRVPTKAFHHEAPYPVVIVEMDNHEKVIGQLVDWEESDLVKGRRVKAVLRRLFSGDSESIIAYHIKFKPTPMKKIKVSAPGKLHFLGEHAIVYNKPAILAAVDKRCFVDICERQDALIKISSRNYEEEKETSIKDLIKKFEKAEKDWNDYDKSNDINLLKSITKDPLDYPQLVIGQFIKYHNLNLTKGFDMVIDSQVPVGCGMGSSGSLAVAVVGALSILFDKPLDKKIINEIAFLAEQKKHGKPSGGDNSTSNYGGLVRFKKDEGVKHLPFSVSDEIKNNFYIVNTGTPKESTGEMVSLVRDLYNEKELFVKEIMDKQEELVKDLYLALEKNIPKQITGIIKMGEANLERIGVVSDYAKGLIRDIESTGAAAKICGAGGVTKSTGIILIYSTDLQKLKKVLESHQLVPTQLTLGVEGLREEKI